MKRTKINDLLNTPTIGSEVIVKGWVRTFRSNRFIAINDGSTINNIQAVLDFEKEDENQLKRITTGASIAVIGEVVASQGKGQSIEIVVKSFEILGDANPEEFPLQPKKHSLEYLREIAHLRFRTNTFSAISRVRHAMIFAVHKFFNDKGFYNIHTPIITGSDAEGAGEMFRVTTLPPINPPMQLKGESEKSIDYSKFRDLENKYFNQLITYLESKRGTKEIGTLYLISTHKDTKDNFKAHILGRPETLSKLIKTYDTSNDETKKTFRQSFINANHISERFISGKVGNFDKRYFVKEIRRICQENNWRLDSQINLPFNLDKKGKTVRRVYSSKKYPFVGLCFYNLFSITDSSQVDFKQDFFGKETNLTVSGQLEAELAALALGQVYTFGPTFRAENSNTTRHLAEFWMIEPEVAFNDINDNMDLAEEMLKYCVKYALDNCAEDLAFLASRLEEEDKSKPQDQRSLPLIEKLKFVVDNEFVRLTYTEAIEILKRSKPNQKGQFKYPINEWGADLQSEHERFLVEKEFKKPVILIDYPAKIKSFYMRQNDDGKTVAAMDILFPGIGEIVGGSQREERLDILKEKIKTFNIPEESVWWYLETRKFGTVPHAGFGLGFERLMLFVTGMTNIRDVIPFPRTPKNAEF